MFLSLYFITVEPNLCTHIWHVVPIYIIPSVHFFYLKLFLWSRLIWHIISTNVTFNYNKTFLSFRIYACKYAPGTSKVPTYLPLYSLITSVMNNPSSNTIDNNTLYPSFKYLFWLIPFVQVILLTIPLLFSFSKFTNSSACLIFAFAISSRFNWITTVFIGIPLSSNFLNYFIIAGITLLPKNISPFFSMHLIKHQVHRCLHIFMRIFIIHPPRFFYRFLYLLLHTHIILQKKS